MIGTQEDFINYENNNYDFYIKTSLAVVGLIFAEEIFAGYAAISLIGAVEGYLIGEAICSSMHDS